MDKVSIVTCTWNRALQMDRGLRSILNQDILPNELVIVDDGSTDNTAAVADKLIQYALERGVKSQYIYLDHPEPRISCYPRNVGIKAATGDIIVFTEPEALHVGNTIAQLVGRMAEYPDNTVLASQVWTIGQRIQGKFTEDDFAHPARIINHPYAMLVEGNMQNTNAPDSDFAITGERHCNAGVLFACRKQWLMDVGGFNEEFEGHGFDDFDLFNRLAVYGKGLRKFDDIIVLHQWHEKNYPYNIYDAAERNGKISETMTNLGQFKANKGDQWGIR